jgi:hypothetical protein
VGKNLKEKNNLRGGEEKFMQTSQATIEVFFTAFKALKSNEQEAFLEKVISNPELREDIIDIALIERLKR